MSKICFLGDIFLNNENTLKCWPKVLHADQCVFNFEYVYDDDSLCNSDAFINKINLRGNGTPFMSGFKSYVANLANNHVMDYKENGLISTLKFCKKNQCQVTGINDFKDYIIPRITHLLDGVTMSSYLQGHMFPKALNQTSIVINKLDINEIIEDAKKAYDEGSRFHIVYLHFFSF
jgi:CTP:phosphocholine cytidylyltransferase-like protein